MAFGGSVFGGSTFGGSSSSIPPSAMAGQLSIGSVEIQGALSVRMELAGTVQVPSVTISAPMVLSRRSRSSGRVVRITSSGRLVDTGNF